MLNVISDSASGNILSNTNRKRLHADPCDRLTCTRMWQACDAIWKRPSCKLWPVCSEPPPPPPPPIFRPKNDISIAYDAHPQTITLLMRQGRGERLVVDRTRVHAKTSFADGVVSVVRLLHHVRHPHRYLSADKTREMSSVSTSVPAHVYALVWHWFRLLKFNAREGRDQL